MISATRRGLTPLAPPAAVALALAILVCRAWGRFAHPDLWGEDGAVFLAQALSTGPRSLLTPMAGSYFTIERLIMLGALQFVPLAWIPGTVCATSVLILAMVAAIVARQRYAWLIPSATVRVLTAGIFCLLPGLSEMLGNLCNLNWILFMWLALTGLKDPALPITKTEIAVSLLIAVSIGTTVLLVPLFAWRVAVLLHARRARSAWLPGLVQLVVLIMFGVVLLVVVPSQRPIPTGMPSYLDIVRAWFDHAVRLAVFLPWIGDRATVLLYERHMTDLYRLAKIASLAFIAIWGWRQRHRPQAQALLVFLAGVSVWTMLAIEARPYAIQTIRDEHALTLYLTRYAFITAFAGIVFWLGVLSLQAADGRRAHLIVGVFITLNLVLPLYRFSIRPYGDERRWLSTVQGLEQSIATGCPRTVVVRQYPDPWEFTYASRSPAPNCQAP